MGFDAFGLDQATLTSIERMGYETPTPVQAAAIPPLLEGRDVVAQARTGSGKTAAFGIPLLRLRGEGIQGLVLVPTRELAVQVTQVLTALAKRSPVRIIAIYGGEDINIQLQRLQKQGPKVLVATPGRLLDHMERDLDIQQTQVLVLDEADRMLDLGFHDDLGKVHEALDAKHQVALFSATLSDEVLELARGLVQDPSHIQVDEALALDADQFMVPTEPHEKPAKLLHLFHDELPDKAVVFTRTKHQADQVARHLDGHGWSAVPLHGGMTQAQRDRSIQVFREGRARVLVATDVAARGLDIPAISHVVNHDAPDQDVYVHRVGRTARQGAPGRAFTFLQPDERLRPLQEVAGRKIKRVDVPVDEVPDGPDPPAGKGGPSGHRPRPPGPRPKKGKKHRGTPRR